MIENFVKHTSLTLMNHSPNQNGNMHLSVPTTEYAVRKGQTSKKKNNRFLWTSI